MVILRLILLIPLLVGKFKAQNVCIEELCPYKCCANDKECITRPDCMREIGNFCEMSSDCLSACCNGKECRDMKDCDNYEVITGVVMGIYFLIIFCVISTFISYKYKKRRLEDIQKMKSLKKTKTLRYNANEDNDIDIENLVLKNNQEHIESIPLKDEIH